MDPNAPIDPNSATMVSELTREATQWGAWINTTSYSTPVYTVPASQPTVSVTLDSTLPYGETAQRLSNAFTAVPIPPGAQQAAGTDGHMTIWQPSTDTLWEFWRASLQSDGWHASWGGRINNVSQNPGYYTGADWSWGASATSLPVVDGMMTIAEQQSGHIDHALAFALPAKYNKFVFPAQRGDGRWSDPRAIPEGAQLRLDPSLNLATLKLPPYTLMLAQAAQQYGIIVRDYSPIPGFAAEDPTPTGSNPYPALWGSNWPNRVLAAFPWSKLQVLQLNYDTTPPAWSTITSGPPARSNAGVYNFTFSAPMPASYQCRLDNGSFHPCEPPTYTKNLKDGLHLVELRAVDPSGNVQPPPYASWSWTQDTTGPVVSFTSQPNAQTNATSATVGWTSNDTSPTYQCQTDGGGWSACSSPVTLAGLADGSHTVSVIGTDDLGNVGSAVSATWTVDTVVPNATIQSGPTGTVATSSPTFTFTADKSSATFQCALDQAIWGTPWSVCSSPYTLTGLGDGPHQLSVRAVDAAGNIQATPAVWSWTQDTTGPVVSLTSQPNAMTNSTSATVGWTSNDASASYQCQTDGGSWNACSSPTTLTGLADGSHTFSVIGTDTLGNQGSAVSATWTVDTVIPTATIQSGPIGTVANNSPTFTFTADKSSATFQCSVDQGSWAACSSPDTLSGLGDGPHQLSVRAVDAAGNIQATPAVWSWTQDTTGPVVSLTSQPNTLTNSTSATIGWTANETSTYQCQTDGGAWNACSSPATLTGLADGSHTFSVRGTDSLGNQGSAVSATWTVDTVVPTATIQSGPAGTVANSSPTFTFTASKSSATFQCSVDQGPWAACSSPDTLSGLGDGPHQLSVRAVDAAGNIQATPAVWSWTQDTTGPVLSLTSQPKSLTNSTSATLAWNSNDPSASYQCQTDGGSWNACSSPTTLTGLADGSHSFSVIGTDTLGNQGGAVSATWTVDTVVPTATIQSGPTGTTANSSPTFTFTASKSSATFQCSLDQGPWAACSSPDALNSLSDGSHTFAVRATDAAGNVSAPASTTFTVDTVPPVATVTVYSSLTQPVDVVFTKGVQNVSNANLLLVSGTNPPVAAALDCRTAGNAKVSCAQGATTHVRINPTQPLIPGQSYAVQVNPSGASPIRDLAGNAAATSSKTFRAPTAAEENSPAVVQTWPTIANPSAIGGSYQADSRPNASASYSFVGSSVDWYTITGPGQGSADVNIDGHLKATTNEQAAATAYGVRRTVNGLSSGSHTIQVVGHGDGALSVDAFGTNGVPDQSASILDSWQSVSASGASGGAYIQDDAAGASVSMTFRGIRLDAYFVTSPQGGLVQIAIDGVTVDTVDTYSSALTYQAKKSYATTNAVHTVVLTVLGQHSTASTGALVGFDRFVIG